MIGIYSQWCLDVDEREKNDPGVLIVPKSFLTQKSFNQGFSRTPMSIKVKGPNEIGAHFSTSLLLHVLCLVCIFVQVGPERQLFNFGMVHTMRES